MLGTSQLKPWDVPTKYLGRPKKKLGRPKKNLGRPKKTLGRPKKTLGRPIDFLGHNRDKFPGALELREGAAYGSFICHVLATALMHSSLKQSVLL